MVTPPANPNATEGPSKRHQIGCIVTFYDGHAELLKFLTFIAQVNLKPGFGWCDPDSHCGDGTPGTGCALQPPNCLSLARPLLTREGQSLPAVQGRRYCSMHMVMNTSASWTPRQAGSRMLVVLAATGCLFPPRQQPITGLNAAAAAYNLTTAWTPNGLPGSADTAAVGNSTSRERFGPVQQLGLWLRAQRAAARAGGRQQRHIQP